jgi:hypothetical protein
MSFPVVEGQQPGVTIPSTVLPGDPTQFNTAKRTCCCGDKECIKLARAMFKIDKRRATFICLPKPVGIHELAGLVRGTEPDKRRHRRERYMSYLPSVCQIRCNEPCNLTKVYYLSTIHFPAWVAIRHYENIQTPLHGGAVFQDVCSYMENAGMGGSLLDRIPGVTLMNGQVFELAYLTVPATPLAAVAAEVANDEFIHLNEVAETQASAGLVYHPARTRTSLSSLESGAAAGYTRGARSSSSSSLSAQTLLEITTLRQEVDRLTLQNQQKNVLIQEYAVETSRMSELLEGQSKYLSRSALVSDTWHALPQNVHAARDFSGFATWAETKATIWATPTMMDSSYIPPHL